MEPSPPFSLALTAGYLTYFQSRVGADCFENGTYRRVLELDGNAMLLSVLDTGHLDSPRLELTVSAENLSHSEALRARDICGHILATGIDLNPFYDKAAEDPVLTALIQPLLGLHPPRVPSIFEGLVFAICGQQVASAVARQIRTLIVNHYGVSLTVDGFDCRSFPSPRQLLDAGLEGLLAVKLSRRKSEYIRGIASKAMDGELELSLVATLTEEQIVERLDKLRGVGSWTAEWVLLRAIGRQDVFPAGDLSLRRILSKRYHLGHEVTEGEARRFAVRWAPFRGLATTYLFAAERLELLNRGKLRDEAQSRAIP